MAESTEFQRWVRGPVEELPEASTTERIRTYNMIDRRVTDHRTGDKSSDVEAILDGDIDKLYQ